MLGKEGMNEVIAKGTNLVGKNLYGNEMLVLA
jgi:hypothetical protein